VVLIDSTNPNKLNPVSGRPVAYKLVPTPSQLLLAHPDSVAHAVSRFRKTDAVLMTQRAEFGDHHVFVTQYRDQELFSGGKYTNQSYGQAAGIRSWIARKDNVDNDDIVVWHTFGLTHNPRVEDFPVMPCETHMVSLKPNDFFSVNPAIDVPASTQAFNQSTLHRTNLQGNDSVETAAKANSLGESCCAK
jgi:primary-amine oxidase